MRNVFDRHVGRQGSANEKITELEYLTMETFKMEKQRYKRPTYQEQGI